MKIAKKKNKKKPIVIVAILLLLAGSAVAGWYYFNSAKPRTDQRSTNPSSNNKSTSSDTEDYHSSDSARIKNEKDTSAKTNPNVDVNQSPQDIPANSQASVEITRVSQSNGVVAYDAQVSGFTQGLCSATFTSELGRTVAKTSSLQNGQCKQEINEMEFDALGEWKLTLRVYHDNTQAVEERSFVIR
jgi:cytoskeletal protein RodZ